MKKALFKILFGFWYGFEIGTVIMFVVLLCTGKLGDFVSESPDAIGVAFAATILIYLITEIQVKILKKINSAFKEELNDANESYAKLYKEHFDLKYMYNELYQKKSCDDDNETVKKNERNWNIWIRNRNLDK